MKKNRSVIPTRFLPAGSKRITNASNERVWLINGKEFYSKAEYFQYLKDQKLSDSGKSEEVKQGFAETINEA